LVILENNKNLSFEYKQFEYLLNSKFEININLEETFKDFENLEKD
jgi:hypothetical protein